MSQLNSRDSRAFLVTGAAGFIGSHLVDALLARGDHVVGLDAFTDYYARELKERNLAAAGTHPLFTLVESDLLDAPLSELVRKADGVFHLAAQPGVRLSWGSAFSDYVSRNVVATQAVFEVAAELGRPVVYASSSSVYGDAESYPTKEDVELRPVSPYGVTKRTCEDLARVYHQQLQLMVTGLRYFTVYGPRQRPDMAFSRIIEAVLTDTAFQVYGDGLQSRDFTFVHDAVRATIDAMDQQAPSLVYNVGGGAEATLQASIAIIERIAGRQLKVERVGHSRGDARRTAANAELIANELAWRPAVSLEEGLSAQVQDMRVSLGGQLLKAR